MSNTDGLDEPPSNTYTFYHNRADSFTLSTREPKDNNSTSDEEEVLFDLDEAALSELPLRLQKNMRDIQFERVRRLHKDKIKGLRPHGPGSKDHYPETWYQNMLEKLSVAQEIEYSRSLRKVSRPQVTEENVWPQFYHQWAPGQQGNDDEMDLSDGRIRWGYDGLLSMGGAAVTAGHRGHSLHQDPRIFFTERSVSASTGFESRCHIYNTQMEDGGGSQQQGESAVLGSRKRSLSIVSAVRDHVRRKLQRVSRLMGI